MAWSEPVSTARAEPASSTGRPTFSLIVATLGSRPTELRRLLESVASQGVSVTVTIADQGQEGGLTTLLREFSRELDISVLRSPMGLSRARNHVMDTVSGEIIGFPDDDAWYPPGALAAIADCFSRNPGIDGLTCPQLDDDGASNARWSGRSGLVTVQGAWTRMASSTIFVRQRVLAALEGFDETLGIGAGTRWEGAEDLDFVVRAVQAGFRIHYNTAISVRHPVSHELTGADAESRALRYGAGVGRTWRKNGLPLTFVAGGLARPLGGVAVHLFRGDLPRARTSFSSLRGRVEGFIGRRR